MANYFVTGISSGIGHGLIRELSRRGHRVWGVARSRERLEKLAYELGADRFVYSVCDVGRKDDIRATCLAMQQAGFLPDVVILNAGINPELCEATFKLDMLEEVIRVNLFGSLAWVETFLPDFRSRSKGQFVAISSLAAYRGDARWVAYSASKSALSRSFESFRGRHTREGISFTTIHLGAVDSGMGVAVRTPFRLSESYAIGRILAAIERRARSVTIPRISRVLLELMRVLPDQLFSMVLERAFAKSQSMKVKSA